MDSSYRPWRSLFAQERLLSAAGLLGLAEALVIALVIAVRGGHVAPEGELGKAAAAAAALGLFTLTAAACLPLARFGARARAVWRWTLLVNVAYSYGFEVTQHARGIDPRLSDFWSPTDHALSVVYFLTSQAYVVLMIALAAGLAGRRARARHPLQVLAVRYGIASVFVGFAAGYRMLLHYQGRALGAADLAFLHALSFHGLQAMMLLAWLIARARLAPAAAARLVHVGGCGWLTATIMLGAHVLAGRALGELSPALLVFGAGLGMFAYVALPLAVRPRRPAPARAGYSVGALIGGALFAIWPTLSGAAAGAPAVVLEVAEPTVRSVDGLDFVAIPGGSFTMGCVAGDRHCDPDERPAREVTVAPFWMARTEVSRALYDRCVREGACAPVAGGLCDVWRSRPDQPVTCVDWSQATGFCRWIDARLPTASEWEYAARSGEAVIYPWGNAQPDAARARYGGLFDGPAPVDSHRAGATKWGLLHMADNVHEWTATDYDGRYKEIRGGAWNGGERQLRASNRAGQEAGATGVGLGFRCAR